MEIKQPVRLVAIDTEVFKRNNFNYKSKVFEQMGKLVGQKKVHILLTKIIEEEILHHLQEEVYKAEKAFKSLYKEFRKKAKIIHNYEMFKEVFCLSFNGDEILKELKKQFYSFVEKLNIEIISLDNVSSEKIFMKYFHSSPPFAEGNKKNEFPDAFSIEALKEKAKVENKKIYVVSGDKDWENSCKDSDNIIYFESLDKLLEEIITEEEPEYIINLYRTIFDQSANDIKKEMEQEFVDFEFTLDHYLADSGSEEIQDVKVDSIDILDASIVSIIYDDEDPDKPVVLFELKTRITFSVDIIYNSIELASWDSEDQMYYNTEYIEDRVNENINIPAEVELCLFRDKNRKLHLDKIYDVCLDPNNSVNRIAITVDFYRDN